MEYNSTLDNTVIDAIIEQCEQEYKEIPTINHKVDEDDELISSDEAARSISSEMEILNEF